MNNLKNLYLITGFLGSGKTTFLQEIAKSFGSSNNKQEIAIIVNEFGSVGVDGAYLNSQGIKSYEITNGSIFCVCRKDLFMDALKMANDLNVETIIVETSGLSDPLTSDDILDQMKHFYNIDFNFKGVVSLIDAKNFKKVLKTAVCIENQVKSADLFVLNKCDLVSDLSEVKKELIMLNADAPIVETTYAKIDFSLFENLEHTRKDGIMQKKDLVLQKKLIEFDKIINLDEFYDWLNDFKDEAYRIKGFLNTEDGSYNFECVMGDYELRKAEFNSEKSFIVILYNANTLKFSKIKEF